MMNTHQMMPGGFRISVLVILAGSAGVWAADERPIETGDVVVVTVGGAKFSLGKKVLSKLDKGTKFRVVQVKGKWVGGKLVVDGKRLSGWVKGSDVELADSSNDGEGSRSTKPDDKNAIDALKKIGAHLELDEQGWVRKVDAGGSKIKDADLALLKGLSNLAELELRETHITDAGLAHLKEINSLKMLYLDETKIGDAGLKQLKGLKGLEVLAVNDTKVTAEGLVHLEGLKNLRVLNLSGNNLDDASLVHIKDLDNLETLALENTGIDGSGLAHLKGLVNLITLNLNDLEIKGDHLLHLKGLGKLRIVYVKNSTVSEESKQQLDEAVPSLAIFD